MLPVNPGLTPFVEEAIAEEEGWFWKLFVLEEFAFARARLRASSKDNNLVGVKIASDLGLNFFGDP